MVEKIRIFICYKKVLSREESGQVVLQKNTEAEILHYLLGRDTRYEPWVDTARIGAGMKWETEIYQHLISSDILLVLIGPGTSKSDWVRREIALANALGIAIIPLGFDISDEQMDSETKALSIDDLQWVITRNIDLQRSDALLAELAGDLERASTETRERRQAVLSRLSAHRATARPKAPDNQRSVTIWLPAGAKKVKLHIATGDITRFRGIDVLVNSENDYMQMARFFESRTISSILRRRVPISRTSGTTTQSSRNSTGSCASGEGRSKSQKYSLPVRGARTVSLRGRTKPG